MENKELLTKIEALEKRISELESLKKDNLSMFGRSYSLVGSSNSDFLIKTKGLIKILWGNKFIDLIKDGKINVDSDFIFSIKSADKIGVKDGIYVTDDSFIYLKIGGKVINLIGEIGTTYVSFLGELETPADSKYTALKNIGFLYPDLNSVGSTSLQNGIIYIESEQKLYIVKDGLLTEFSIDFPNPFTEQFIILKNDASIGALLIKGEGIYNSLAFDSFYIFTEEGNTFLQSEGEINIMLNDETYINVTQSKTTIRNIVETNTLQSIGASTDSGFMLFMEDGGSTLIVDNLIVRNLSNSVTTSIYPTLWSLEHNVITKVEEVADATLGSGYALSLKYENHYKIGDYIYFYADVKTDDYRSQVVKIPAVVRMLNTETGNIVYVEILTEYIEDLASLQEMPDCIGKITFLIGSDEMLNLVRYSEHLIDLIQCLNVNGEQDILSILSRFGLLDDLLLKERDNVAKTEPPISGQGSYDKLGFFFKAGYVNTYELLDEDDSTNMASTEWVRKLIKKIIPKGTITAYHGEGIPEGWALCDGTNGTPDLIGKFIKADSVEAEDGLDEILLTPNNIPSMNSSSTITTNAGAYAGKLIPVLNTVEEYVFDEGGSSHFCLYTGNKRGDNGLTSIAVDNLGSLLDLSGSVGVPPELQQPIKIEPKYYSLVFIMKME